MSLLNDIRVDIGDDTEVFTSGTSPAPISVAQAGPELGILVRDIRVDIGDESDVYFSGIFPPASSCVNYSVVSSASYTILSTDALIMVDPVSPYTTINLPAVGTEGCVFTIKDRLGTAAVNNIRINPGASTIDGFPLWVMNQNKQSVALTWTGLEWGIV